jgi:nucleotide-binding universal stress UspA family protein
MNILVAVDLSEATPRVMQVTERVARQSEGKVRLLHVAEAEPDFMGYDAGPEVVRDQVAKEFRDEHKSIQAYAEQLREAGLDASARLIQGPIVETVFNVLIGSISRGILKDTDIPVLVVPIRDPSLRP